MTNILLAKHQFFPDVSVFFTPNKFMLYFVFYKKKGLYQNAIFLIQLLQFLPNQFPFFDNI